MKRTVGIGHQDFEYIRQNNLFYIDKTSFLAQWWQSNDSVTLITRPRRFGKTLNMSMTEKFFSLNYSGRKDLFEGLLIWEQEAYRKLQGTYPVITFSFANIKEKDYSTARRKICQILSNLYSQYNFICHSDILDNREKDFFESVSADMDDVTATMAVHQLALFLHRYYNKKVIILLDEYDTPMQEAYVNGYWEEITGFMRSMLNATFKTNPYMERAIMTGITRITKESIFSDLNNLKVITTTSEKYADCFGFTEQEVFSALDEFGLSDRKEEVKEWYDGFTFGNRKDIYNPWSVLNYLDTQKIAAYWAHSSANSLVEKLLREGSRGVKQDFEKLMYPESITIEIDEAIAYEQLAVKKNAVWSLLLAGGYLRVIKTEFQNDTGRWYYTLSLTNKEVYGMFENMIRTWFSDNEESYSDFIQALLSDDVDSMNDFMNRIAMSSFSFFDTGRESSDAEPERFYHGFVLGLMVELKDRYILSSNRESGLGRYDIMLKPRELEKEHDKKGRWADDYIIMEFKVFQPKREKELSDTVKAALGQIEDRKYAQTLLARGILPERIRKYGFAFHGKQVLIGRQME